MSSYCVWHVGVGVCSGIPEPSIKVVLLASVETFADSVLTAMPRWDHIITNRVYNSDLARRQLLQHPLRATLGDKISSLSVYKDLALDILTELGSQDIANRPVALGAGESLDIASATMSIMAACNVYEEFRNSSRGADMAHTLLRQVGAKIPESLRKLLENMTTS